MTNTPRQFALEVAAKLQESGYEALWAGGCVRDELLGIRPKDFDVATNAKPEQVQDLFGRHRTLAIGASFGVITVLGPGSAGQVEVATFRSDGDYSDGRHPDSVEYSTAQEDAARRDFTINGIFFDPVTQTVIDYVDGQADLEGKVIRAIGDPHERIEEDKLRMLRAARFAANYEFELDPVTAAAIRERAPKIDIVSRERIAAEIRRMLSHPNRRVGVEQLVDLKLIEPIFPSSILAKRSGGAWPDDETLSVLANVSSQEFAIALAAWLRNLTRDPTELETICRNWKLSNDETATTLWLIETEPMFRTATELPWPQIQRRLIHQSAWLAIDLAEAIVSTLTDGGKPQSTGKQSLEFCRNKLALPSVQLNPPPLISGDDLNRMGLTPGPQFKRILTAIRDAQLDQRISSADDAIAMARTMAEG